jgi:dTDP-4-dehydrorhamnose 3,5-epimerase
MTISGTQPLRIEGAFIFKPPRFEDDRGWTGEIVSSHLMEGLASPFVSVQENQSFSRFAGVTRGLHFQKPPFSQAKVVRVANGAVLSVVLDLRTGRSSFERCETVRQSLSGGECLYVPAGCAHGVQVLEGATVLCWTSDAPFDAASADGVLLADPALQIDLPFSGDRARYSERDLSLPSLAKQPFRFDFSGRHSAG